MLCRVTVRSKQMQLQMPCLVGLRERPLGLHVSEPRSHVFEPHVSAPCFHVFEPHAFEPRVFESFFGPHSFGPHLVDSLYFFDPDPAPPDSRLRNICPVLATSVVRRVLKQASWRTYKDNGSGMKLSCRAIERRRSEPDNQDQIIRTEHPGLEGWEDSDGIFYKKLPYASEIIKAELTSRHPDDILACGSKSKRPVDWLETL